MYKIFLNERIILAAVVLNIIVLFLLSFSTLRAHFHILEYIDNLLTIFFFLEAIVKIYILTWPAYIKSGWNRMDLGIVILSTPSLLLYFLQVSNFPLMQVFRSLRVIKFFRFLKFIPRFETILQGLSRAIKASLLVLIAFFLYNLIISLFSCYLFKDIAPQYFGNALMSFYTIFKMCTLDGWNEVPEAIIRSSESTTFMVFDIFYFVFVVISGGIFGLSIVNAIFVNEMLSNNNVELETRIDGLENKVDILINKLEEGNLLGKEEGFKPPKFLPDQSKI